MSHINPHGSINNSDLELVGAVLHNVCAADCYDVRERTTLARTDNIAAMWWGRKGSATYTSPPAHLLRLSAMHQRGHRYLLRQDFVSGVDNLISDRPSRSVDLTDAQLLAFLDKTFPQRLPWRL